jgi:hypothetical protein
MREPDLERDGWTLEDGEDRHRAAPDTFPIPSLTVREGLQRGDYAKLIFRIAREDDEDAYERMWVSVTRRTPSGYMGILNNKPSLIAQNADFSLGSELPFGARHIIAALPADNESYEFIERGPAIPWDG